LDRVKSLSNVLRDIEDLPRQELNSQQTTEFHDIAEGCHNVLAKLNETLEKYQELDSDPKTFGRKVRRVWKRLEFEPEDITELRSRIVDNTTLLNALQARLDR
jgi:tRNA C32,U32 (ribose-2'-O)-methylase TrmJ